MTQLLGGRHEVRSTFLTAPRLSSLLCTITSQTALIQHNHRARHKVPRFLSRVLAPSHLSSDYLPWPSLASPKTLPRASSQEQLRAKPVSAVQPHRHRDPGSGTPRRGLLSYRSRSYEGRSGARGLRRINRAWQPPRRRHRSGRREAPCPPRHRQPRGPATVAGIPAADPWRLPLGCLGHAEAAP